ncbi:MAG: hypothetical protein M1816_007413 [Peltula sp. TS41687]|nr:MAG: hypothetical protein M1816_007413 [Peltula sp. TS41687]
MGKFSNRLLAPLRWVRSRLRRGQSQHQTLRTQFSNRSQESLVTLASGGSNVAIYVPDQPDTFFPELVQMETTATLPSYHEGSTPSPEYTPNIPDANETAQESASYNGSFHHDPEEFYTGPTWMPGVANHTSQLGSDQRTTLAEPTERAETLDPNVFQQSVSEDERGSQHNESTPGPDMTILDPLVPSLINIIGEHREVRQLREDLEAYEAAYDDAKSRLRVEIHRLDDLVATLSDASDSEDASYRQPIIQAINAGQNRITFLEESCTVWESQVTTRREQLTSAESEQARLVHQFLDQACAAIFDNTSTLHDREEREDPENIEQAPLPVFNRHFVSETGRPEPAVEAESEVPPSPVQEERITNQPSSMSGPGSESSSALHRAEIVNELDRLSTRLQYIHAYRRHLHNGNRAVFNHLAEEEQDSTGIRPAKTRSEFEDNFLINDMHLGRQREDAMTAFKDTKHHARGLGIDVRHYGTPTEREEASTIVLDESESAGYGYPASFEEAELADMVDREVIEAWMDGFQTHHVSTPTTTTEDRYDDDEDAWESGSVDIGDSVSLRAVGFERRRIDAWREFCEETLDQYCEVALQI